MVAQELRAHGHKLFYYDQRKQGEVDYLIDNYTVMSPLPREKMDSLQDLSGNPSASFGIS